MKVIYTFPGQGTQRPNMLHQLPDGIISQRSMEEAADILKENPLLLDQTESLKATRSVQLCLLITGVIHARWLIEEGLIPDMVAGLSIGAFPAAVIAGSLTFSDSLRLVALRGELMQQAYPSGFGMMAISGFTEWKLQELVNQVHSPDNPVYIANINSEQQIVLSGKDEALEKVARMAQDKGAFCAKRIAISVPSHCVLMQEPAEKLFEAMAKFPVKDPVTGYISGSTGRYYRKADDIRKDLAFNMARNVRWFEAMTAAFERGARCAIEMPPASVLTGLTRGVFHSGEVLSLEATPLDTLKVLYQRIKTASNRL